MNSIYENFYIPDIYSRMLTSPHILIAGTTGSGKSVALNSLLYSAMLEAIRSEKNASFTYIDLKMIELVDWRDLPNCAQYVDFPEDAPTALEEAVDSMYRRYKEMQRLRIKETTEGHVYIVVDELADFVSNKKCLDYLVTLGRLGRAAHYHLILCTQDPSRNTLSASLLQNMTCRVALRTKSPIESRQIVGIAGAEKLPAHGRALLDLDGRIENVEIPMVPEDEIKRLITTIEQEEGVINQPYQPTPEELEGLNNGTYFTDPKTGRPVKFSYGPGNSTERKTPYKPEITQEELEYQPTPEELRGLENGTYFRDPKTGRPVRFSSGPSSSLSKNPKYLNNNTAAYWEYWEKNRNK